MDIKKLDLCIEESNRFIAKAKDLKAALVEAQKTEYGSHPRALSGAVKRSSLDLSKSLSNLRKA